MYSRAPSRHRYAVKAMEDCASTTDNGRGTWSRSNRLMQNTVAQNNACAQRRSPGIRLLKSHTADKTPVTSAARMAATIRRVGLCTEGTGRRWSGVHNATPSLNARLLSPAGCEMTINVNNGNREH